MYSTLVLHQGISIGEVWYLPLLVDWPGGDHKMSCVGVGV